MTMTTTTTQRPVRPRGDDFLMPDVHPALRELETMEKVANFIWWERVGCVAWLGGLGSGKGCVGLVRVVRVDIRFVCLLCLPACYLPAVHHTF